MPSCPKCSAAAPDRAEYCASCGAALNEGLPPTEALEPSRSTDSRSQHGRFLPGAPLGARYRIVGLLGRGGMGEVYRADDLELGQSVALKFLPEKLAADPRALERLRGEVRTARQIAHPNVCRVYDIGQLDGHVFLSMEYVDGDDLSHVLRRLGPPSRDKSLEIARQLCLGLAAAHENEVLHRDLKPANVMLDGRGRVRITDFGLAGLVADLEADPQRAGTPAYMAPEQRESGRVSVRSDIYSLGLVLYELFTGKRPFEGTTLEELKRSRTSESIPSMQSQTESVDPAIERVVMRCLEPNPDDRPSSVYAVLAALPGGDPLAAALAAGETPSPELVANARDAGGLRPAVAIGLLAAALASLGAVWAVYRGRTVVPERPPRVLSVVAEQTLEEFGYRWLPPNSVSGYDTNAKISRTLDRWPGTVERAASAARQPPFRYWRRFSDGEFLSVHHHVPHTFAIDGETDGASTTATVALDSTGRLIGLTVAPPDGVLSTAGTGTDWSPLFRRAGLEPADFVEIPLVEPAPVRCDEVVAWQNTRGPGGRSPTVVQTGAFAGRVNYFEILRLDESMIPRPQLQQILVTLSSTLWKRQAFLLVMIALGIHNLIKARADRRNALRFGLFVGGLYCVMEAVAFPFGGPLTVGRIAQYTNGHHAGHVLIHGIEGWLIYIAVEPYVRRVWPRMLVGVIRLLSGRLRDPAVGRELLIGVACGCGLAALAALGRAAGWGMQLDGVDQPLHRDELWAAISPLHFVAMKAHRVAWMAIDGGFLIGLFVALRLLVRNTAAATVLGAAVLVRIIASRSWNFGLPDEFTLVFALAGGLVIALLYTRVGLLSGMIVWLVAQTYSVTGVDFGSWFAPYAIAEILIPIGIAAYGFWVSLAGRPIFRDLLAEP